MANSKAAPSRDAERSRQAILAAAESAFAEHGFDGVSLARIAEHAGLSRAQLQTLGLTLGADVPIFIHGRAAFA